MIIRAPSGRRRRLTGLSINRLLPNMLTLLALCAGLTAMRFALHERFQAAVVAIIIAAILDALDGRVARRLGSTSRFGAELDSLSDFLSFGVAPAFMLYLWSMQDAGSLGWALVLLFPVCSALRLARFNTSLTAAEPPPPWMAGFFVGVPAPAGAGLVLLPMMISFEVGESIFRHPIVVGTALAVVGGLMVSRIPTFSFKRGRIPARFVLPTMLLVALLAAVTVTSPWTTMPLVALIYLATFPFSIRAAEAARRAAANDDRHAAAQPSPAEASATGEPPAAPRGTPAAGEAPPRADGGPAA